MENKGGDGGREGTMEVEVERRERELMKAEVDGRKKEAYI